MGEIPLGRNTLGKVSLGENHNFDLKEEGEGDLKRRNGFHLHSSPLSLFSLIFMLVFLHSMR